MRDKTSIFSSPSMSPVPVFSQTTDFSSKCFDAEPWNLTAIHVCINEVQVTSAICIMRQSG